MASGDPLDQPVEAEPAELVAEPTLAEFVRGEAQERRELGSGTPRGPGPGRLPNVCKFAHLGPQKCAVVLAAIAGAVTFHFTFAKRHEE